MQLHFGMAIFPGMVVYVYKIIHLIILIDYHDKLSIVTELLW